MNHSPPVDTPSDPSHSEPDYALNARMKAEALIQLGDMIARKKSLQAAENCYRQATQLAPDLPRAWKKLGMSQADAGRPDDQLNTLHNAVYLCNEDPESIYILGRRLEKLNRLSDLEAILRKYHHRFSDNPWILTLEAINNWRKGDIEQAMATSLHCLTRSPVDKLKQYLYWLLGTLLDRLGRYREAYQYFESMNQLSRKNAQDGPNNDFHEHIARHMLYTQNIPADYDQSCLICADENDRGPIFLTGFPRSGTTLLGRLLNSHPDLETRDEWLGIRTVINLMTERRFHYPEHISELTNETLREMRAQYREKMRIEGSAEGYVDKMPLNLVHLGLILKLFPRARILVMLRNPYDACLSCFSQNFSLNWAMLNFLSLESTARTYDHVMSLAKLYLENRQIAIHCVRYEDLTANVEQTAKSIFDFLEVPWSPNVLQFNEHAKRAMDVRTPSYHQMIKPIYRHSVERWRGYREFLQPVSQWLAPWCRYFNYPAISQDCSQEMG